MPAKPARKVATRPQLVTGTLIDNDPQKISRLLSDLGDRVAQHDAAIVPRTVLTLDLAVGTNRIAHSLGRRAQGVSVAPAVADPTWAWTFTIDSDRTVTITCVGVAQPGAKVEVY